MELCNLNYLKSVSPDNPKFIKEMIQLFLKNAPLSLEAMNNCFITEDWNGLQHRAHKIISDINCMGIPKDYGNIAKHIEEYAEQHQHLDLIPDLLLKLESAIHLASKELREELNKNYDILN